MLSLKFQNFENRSQPMPSIQPTDIGENLIPTFLSELIIRFGRVVFEKETYKNCKNGVNFRELIFQRA